MAGVPGSRRGTGGRSRRAQKEEFLLGGGDSLAGRDRQPRPPDVSPPAREGSRVRGRGLRPTSHTQGVPLSRDPLAEDSWDRNPGSRPSPGFRWLTPSGGRTAGPVQPAARGPSASHSLPARLTSTVHLFALPTRAAARGRGPGGEGAVGRTYPQ